MDYLYIIGNGFDLSHGIKSSYWHFKNFVEANNKPLFESLEKYFYPDDFWSVFEEALADLDTDVIRDEAANYLQSYGADDWSDAYHHDYQYEIDQRIDIVTAQLKNEFTKWVLSLSVPDSTNGVIVFKGNALFLNFNYTPTLQRIYNIPSERILHIHNAAVNMDSNLILGHGRKPSVKKDGTRQNDNEDSGDPRVQEGEDLISDYFSATYKSTEGIIQQHPGFFLTLKALKHIYVLGHSLAPVDIPYFKEILKNIDVESTSWTVSFFKEEEKKHHLEVLMDLGVAEHLITMDRLGDIDSPQISLFR
jgi:hypothetical protein